MHPCDARRLTQLCQQPCCFPACHVTGRLDAFDVGVGSVHSQITHASVLALVLCVPGAGASFSVLAAIIVGGLVVATTLSGVGS